MSTDILPCGSTDIRDMQFIIDTTKHFELAQQIYTDHVTNFLNGQPGYRHSLTTLEQKAVYELALVVQALREELRVIKELKQ